MLTVVAARTLTRMNAAAMITIAAAVTIIMMKTAGVLIIMTKNALAVVTITKLKKRSAVAVADAIIRIKMRPFCLVH